jgi:hypothetical protein
MREERSEKYDTTPWRVPVAVEDVAESGQHFTLTADAEIRSNVARLAGLRDLPRLEASLTLTRHGAGGLRVKGRVSATVGQTCVVTLEPLVNELEEAVDILFLPRSDLEPQAGKAASQKEVAAPKWDDPEPLVDGRVDLGAIATEFVLLGLDPYPRKPGAVFKAPDQAKEEAGAFAALASLTKGRHGR